MSQSSRQPRKAHAKGTDHQLFAASCVDRQVGSHECQHQQPQKTSAQLAQAFFELKGGVEQQTDASQTQQSQPVSRGVEGHQPGQVSGSQAPAREEAVSHGSARKQGEAHIVADRIGNQRGQHHAPAAHAQTQPAGAQQVIAGQHEVIEGRQQQGEPEGAVVQTLQCAMEDAGGKQEEQEGQKGWTGTPQNRHEGHQRSWCRPPGLGLVLIHACPLLLVRHAVLDRIGSGFAESARSQCPAPVPLHQVSNGTRRMQVHPGPRAVSRPAHVLRNPGRSTLYSVPLPREDFSGRHRFTHARQTAARRTPTADPTHNANAPGLRSGSFGDHPVNGRRP